MLDRLSDELVLAILDHLASPKHDKGLYPDNQDVLRHLCLSSSRLRRLAQPSLWRQVPIRAPQQLDDLRSAAATTDLGRYTRTYAVNLPLTRSSTVLAVSHILPNVEDVRLSLFRSAPAFGLLEGFAKLRRLDLSQVTLNAQAIILPHLDKLSITHSRVDVAGLTEWLQPSNVPALRCLHWFAVLDIARRSIPQLVTLVHPPLLAQLDYVFAHENAVAPDSELGRGTAPPVLHIGGWHSPFFPRHTLYGSAHFEQPTAAADKLREMAAQLLAAVAPGHRPPRPSVVFLSTLVRRLASHDAHVARALVDFEHLCGASRVRVIWYDAEDEDDMALVPYASEFRKYGQELRRTREGEAAATAAATAEGSPRPEMEHM